MKIDRIFNAIGLTLAAFAYSILELLWLALQYLTAYLVMAIVTITKAIVFVVMLPYSLCKCAARAKTHRSFAAGGQLAKWIWIDYWKTTKI